MSQLTTHLLWKAAFYDFVPCFAQQTVYEYNDNKVDLNFELRCALKGGSHGVNSTLLHPPSKT